MNLAASAPGKLVLMGEYAVLEGATAISTAVDRRANVRMRTIQRAEIEVHAPDVQAHPARLRPHQGIWRWTDPAEAARLPLVDQVLRRTLGPTREAETGFRLRLDTESFFAANCGQRLKLGLGSSAALTVACASAVTARAEDGKDLPAPASSKRTEAPLQRMLEIHQQFQNGQGSGVDVATSLLGGTLLYRRGPGADKARVETMRWPARLRHRCVWSGRSASTPRMLERLGTWKCEQPRAYEEGMGLLRLLADAGATALRKGDDAELLRLIRMYADALQTLDTRSGLGIVSPEHARLAEIAGLSGVVYKSCGAGGGDLGVALSLDPERIARFDADLLRHRFLPVPLNVDAPGLRCEFDLQEES